MDIYSKHNYTLASINIFFKAVQSHTLAIQIVYVMLKPINKVANVVFYSKISARHHSPIMLLC